MTDKDEFIVFIDDDIVQIGELTLYKYRRVSDKEDAANQYGQTPD